MMDSARGTNRLPAYLAMAASFIVVGGGGAFFYFAETLFGKALGLTHLIVGSVLLGLALNLFDGRGRLRLLGLFWSGIVVAYSCVTEAVVLAYGILPSGPTLGSLGGTLIAVAFLACTVALLIGAAE